MVYISDKRLFAIILYSAFANSEFLSTFRDIWKNHWVTGIAATSAVGLVGALIAPTILMAIIHALGFNVGGIAANSFGSWFMSLHGGMVGRRSLLSMLQATGAAGLGAFGTSIVSSFGMAIGILIGAVGGSKLATYFEEMDLNEPEKHALENFIQIEENNNHDMIIFTLMPALLYNDTMLKCFVETFMTCSPFANSKLFKFYFKDDDIIKLKSEEEKVNNTIYNLLINDYEKSRLKYIFHDEYYFLVGYNLDLNGYESSDSMINLLVEIWMYINGITVINIDIDKFRHEIDNKIQGISIFFHDKLNKYFNIKDDILLGENVCSLPNRLHLLLRDYIECRRNE